VARRIQVEPRLGHLALVAHLVLVVDDAVALGGIRVRYRQV